MMSLKRGGLMADGKRGMCFAGIHGDWWVGKLLYVMIIHKIAFQLHPFLWFSGFSLLSNHASYGPATKTFTDDCREVARHPVAIRKGN
ncbi:hypothetical protein NMG60_11023935 [Bertholletia excelsa]